MPPDAERLDARFKKLEFWLSDTKQSTSKFLIDNFRTLFVRLSEFAKSTYDFFNRHYVRLELLVSYRKQTTGPLSNRHKFAFFHFPPPPCEAPHA